MRIRKGKIVLFCLLSLCGAALFIYGVCLHSTNVLPQQADDSTILAKSEPALIKDVTVGGVTREQSGRIRQTYTGKAPEACPT